MRTMTTIYIDDEHINFFKKNTDLKMSQIIRQLLTRYIETKNRRLNKIQNNKVEVKND